MLWGGLTSNRRTATAELLTMIILRNSFRRARQMGLCQVCGSFYQKTHQEDNRKLTLLTHHPLSAPPPKTPQPIMGRQEEDSTKKEIHFFMPFKPWTRNISTPTLTSGYVIHSRLAIRRWKKARLRPTGIPHSQPQGSICLLTTQVASS